MFESRQQYTECVNFLVNHEPCMQRSLTLIEDYILSNKPVVTITGKDTSESFSRFFDKHFMVIARQVFRYNLLCGFVPWTVITLKTGEKAPKILPIGSFAWEIRCVDRSRKRQRTGDTSHDSHATGNHIDKGKDNIYLDEPVFLKYSVESTLPIGVEVPDIIVTTLTEPSLSAISKDPSPYSTSTRFAVANTMFSPIVSVAYSYNRLERALHRRSYADDWNTTARIVTSNNPPRMNNDAPDMGMLDGLAGSGSAGMASTLGSYSYDNMQLRFSPYDTNVQNILTKNNGGPGEHCPSVYTLPQHYKIEKLDTLTPVEDPMQLSADYQRSVSQITGVPLSLVQNFEKNAGLGSGEDPMLMDRLVEQVCKRISLQIQKVLTEMYMYLYHPNTLNDINVESKITMKFKFSHLAVEEPTSTQPKPKPKAKPKQT
jgi:hypothetical protein